MNFVHYYTMLRKKSTSGYVLCVKMHNSFVALNFAHRLDKELGVVFKCLIVI
jgi:hypothetical protein